MIHFILNDKEIATGLPRGETLLDYIRYHENLTGTKIGCREGDCGACTILIGELIENRLRYRSATSCLTPLGNVAGKHVVTVEGLNTAGPHIVQQAMQAEGATQCGFCTPGFVVSLAGFCLGDAEKTFENAIAAIDGNICRCTGYKSIQRAAMYVAEEVKKLNGDALGLFPGYLSGIRRRLMELESRSNGSNGHGSAAKRLGGGTDLYVQQPEHMVNADIDFLFNKNELNGIIRQDNRCVIGASATVTDLMESAVMQKAFPSFKKVSKLVSSTPIRNIATIAGNFVNASPIGDFTIFFLALDAQLLLTGKGKREIPLREFYKGYKQLNKNEDECIEQISFDIPGKGHLFNFEKVSKRTHLDIASVNTALSLEMDGKIIIRAGLSAGGVGPVPAWLAKTSGFLQGKKVTTEMVDEAIDLAQSEISPISDARGSETYKRLLLGQLLRAHFITLFPKIKFSPAV